MVNNVHLVVFCSIDHVSLLEECIKSIEQNVQDDISKKIIISNTNINISGFQTILDNEIWDIIDPDFVYKNVYKHNWVKQQILKLNLDKILEGDVLLCDTEVRYVKHIQWKNNNKYKVFYNRKCTAIDFVKKAIGITATNGFLTESMIFSTDILQSLRKHVENFNNDNQLAVYRNIVYDDPLSDTPLHKIFMSEYELYNTYLTNYYADRIWELIDYRLDDTYHSIIQSDIFSHAQNSKTQWITFYNQIKDESWPDCYSFDSLPDHIKQECIEVFGYIPPTD